jgi:Kef-type K+ transport system membrane component KefB
MHLGEAVTLLLFSMGAFLIPLGTGRIGLPAAVGEIIYGVLIGPQLAGLIHPSPFTTFFAELGFCFLMFLAGLELDFPRIQRAGSRNLALGVAVAALFFVVAYVETALFKMPLFLFLVFGATSVGILLVTLNELGMTKGKAGQAMIFVGSVGEFLTIVLLTGLGFYYKFGLGLQLLAEMGKLAAIFAAAYIVLVLLRTLIWWWPGRFSRVVASHDPSEIGVRAGLALMLVFIALASLLGVEAILGAFVAGALFSFVFREKGILETKLSSIGFGFFVPMFFIWVGTEFDLSAVLDGLTLKTVGLFFLLSLAAKLLPSMALLLAKLSLREATGAGLLLGAPLTLLVAISRIGLDVKVIDKTTASAVVLLAIATGVVLPWTFRLLMRRSATTEPH